LPDTGQETRLIFEEGRGLTEGLPDTEKCNPVSTRLDKMDALEILQLMNGEDRKVPDAIEGALAQMLEAVGVLLAARHAEGRRIYVSAEAG
jgi:N-acetylmuramic acid 6-phosphate etherase